MSTEINFIKHKWLLSEFNEFRKTDPAYLRNKEIQAEWKRKNRDKVLEHQSKYVENNKEKVVESVRNWQKNNKEKHIELQIKYQKNNREKINKYQRERYRAIKWITK